MLFFDKRGFHQALIGSFGRVVFFDIAAFDFSFRDKFHIRAEEVVIQAPEAIEVINGSHQLRVFDSLISEELPDMGIVFLFYMGVVVFNMRPGAGKGYFSCMFREVPDQVIVKELGAVIDMEAFDGEREYCFYIS